MENKIKAGIALSLIIAFASRPADAVQVGGLSIKPSVAARAGFPIMPATPVARVFEALRKLNLPGYNPENPKDLGPLAYYLVRIYKDEALDAAVDPKYRSRAESAAATDIKNLRAEMVSQADIIASSSIDRPIGNGDLPFRQLAEDGFRRLTQNMLEMGRNYSAYGSKQEWQEALDGVAAAKGNLQAYINARLKDSREREAGRLAGPVDAYYTGLVSNYLTHEAPGPVNPHIIDHLTGHFVADQMLSGEGRMEGRGILPESPRLQRAPIPSDNAFIRFPRTTDDRDRLAGLAASPATHRIKFIGDYQGRAAAWKTVLELYRNKEVTHIAIVTSEKEQCNFNDGGCSRVEGEAHALNIEGGLLRQRVTPSEKNPHSEMEYGVGENDQVKVYVDSISGSNVKIAKVVVKRFGPANAYYTGAGSNYLTQEAPGPVNPYNIFHWMGHYMVAQVFSRKGRSEGFGDLAIEEILATAKAHGIELPTNIQAPGKHPLHKKVHNTVPDQGETPSGQGSALEAWLNGSNYTFRDNLAEFHRKIQAQLALIKEYRDALKRALAARSNKLAVGKGATGIITARVDLTSTADERGFPILKVKPMPFLNIKLEDRRSVQTDKDGRFSVDSPDGKPIKFTATLSGKYVTVYDSSSKPLKITGVVTPGKEKKFSFNPDAWDWPLVDPKTSRSKTMISENIRREMRIGIQDQLDILNVFGRGIPAKGWTVRFNFASRDRNPHVILDGPKNFNTSFYMSEALRQLLYARNNPLARWLWGGDVGIITRDNVHRQTELIVEFVRTVDEQLKTSSPDSIRRQPLKPQS